MKVIYGHFGVIEFKAEDGRDSLFLQEMARNHIGDINKQRIYIGEGTDNAETDIATLEKEQIDDYVVETLVITPFGI
jgi:hypothetical protein